MNSRVAIRVRSFPEHRAMPCIEINLLKSSLRDSDLFIGCKADVDVYFSRCLQFKQFLERYRKGFRYWGFHKIKWQGESLTETLQHKYSLRSNSNKFVYLLFESISLRLGFPLLRLQLAMEHVRNIFQVNIVFAEKQFLFKKISKADDWIDKVNVLTESLQTLWVSMIFGILWQEIKSTNVKQSSVGEKNLLHLRKRQARLKAFALTFKL